MREAGVTFVTLGVFSWAWLEPAKGEYDFGWLDEVMDLLHDDGIAVDLATATATPPPWLTAAHPEILPVDRDGHTLWPGSRQAWCPSSPLYREHALALTDALAAALPRPPGPGDVARLQRVRLPQPALLLRRLRRRLPRAGCAAATATLDALNDAWGTAFWSQRYTDWDEVLPPRRTHDVRQPHPAARLPALRLRRAARLLPRRARGVLHEHSPGVPVTTNFMTLTPLPPPRLPRWAPEQDVVSNDHYLVDAPRAPARRAGLQRRPHPRPGRRPAVDAHGALHQRGQLAAGQPRQGPRRDASATASPTWPAAPTPSASSSGGQSRAGRGEVPLRPGAARRHATAPASARSCELGAIAEPAR